MREMPPPARFVPLTTVGDVNTARILAAKLASEGIEVRVHGDALGGVYPVTVGALAETQLWVLSDQVEEASRLLLDAEVLDALHGVEHDETEGLPAEMPVEWRAVAVGVGVVLVALVVLRLLAVY